MIGNIINNYIILTKLGEGSYGKIYMVYNMIKEDYYALKNINYKYSKDAEEEIAIWKQLTLYKNINLIELVECFRYQTDKKKTNTALIMKLYACDLYQYIKINNFEKKEIIDISKQILDGLNIIHYKLKAIHGDLKTDNILIEGTNNKIEYYKNKNEELKCENKKEYQQKIRDILDFDENLKINIRDPIKIVISDFGIVCLDKQKYNNSFGTKYYRSLELYLGLGYNKTVDIWAFGCILLELIKNKIYFHPNQYFEYDEEDDLYENALFLILFEKKIGKIPNSLIDYGKNKKPKLIKLYQKLKRENINIIISRLDEDIEDENFRDIIKKCFEYSKSNRIDLEKLNIYFNQIYFNQI